MTALSPGAHEFQLPDEFAFFEGGPLRPLWLRLRSLGQVRKWDDRARLFSIAACIAFTWLPLVVLTLWRGSLWSRAGIPLLRDVEVHTRFLATLPLLLWGNGFADRVLPLMLEAFVKNDIVRDEDRPRFAEIVASAARWNRSRVLLVLLVVFVAVTGRLVWHQELAGRPASWYGAKGAGIFQLTPAGYWYAIVSIPVFQFILYRWYLRLLLWWALLLRISRLNLRLIATDPDDAGGLGFLGSRVYAFVPFLLAQGVMVAGMVGNHILNEQRRLHEHYREIGAFSAFAVMMVLGPMTAFVRPLVRAKRQGKGEYGLLAAHYVGAFQRKWIHPVVPPREPLLGNADLRSLADLAHGHTVVDGMMPVPFGKDTLLKVFCAVLAPVAPLVLTEVPVSSIARAVLELVA